MVVPNPEEPAMTITDLVSMGGFALLIVLSIVVFVAKVRSL